MIVEENSLRQAKEKFFNIINGKEKLVVTDTYHNDVRMTSFSWSDNVISPKTDCFLFLSCYDELYRRTYYLAMRHIRNNPILKWNRIDLPHAKIQIEFCRILGFEPPYNIESLGTLLPKYRI